jgi:error-prone DNA polymerase
MVVARQRPGTANGIVFLLLEDEYGTTNLIVPPDVYERHRLTVRTAPLVLAAGRLEHHPAGGGAINVLVERLEPIHAPDQPTAELRRFASSASPARTGTAGEAGGGEGQCSARTSSEDTAGGVEDETGDFRAVAPAVMSFGSGRRR